MIDAKVAEEGELLLTCWGCVYVIELLGLRLRD